jgi:hypothetical protein
MRETICTAKRLKPVTATGHQMAERTHVLDRLSHFIPASGRKISGTVVGKIRKIVMIAEVCDIKEQKVAI